MKEESQNIVVGSDSMPFDKEYAQWIAELAKRYRSSQIKALIKVNDEMLRFYWSVGEDIERRQFENRYGGRFYENVSKDLKHALGLSEGLSPTTIKYTRYFYQLYSPLFANRQQGVDESVSEIRQQGVDEFEMLFLIPWSHHTRIIDKVKGDGRKGLFFVRKSLENNWGRGVLLNFLSTDLYERQGAAQTNFALTMPAPESDLAQELLKSPFIEVKITEFDFPDLGQLAGYVAMVDDLLNTEVEKPAIGLLICKEKNAVLARYALSGMNRPMGISEYEVARQQLPDDLKKALPSTDEIEAGLNRM